MNSAKLIFLTLFGINAFALFVTLLNQMFLSDTIQSMNAKVTGPLVSYKFDNPVVAYNLLETLDVFSDAADGSIRGSHYNYSAGGFKVNLDYCKEHRHFFVNHPDDVFNEKTKFMTNYWNNHKLRQQVIPQVGIDLHPEVSIESHSKLYKFFRIDMKPDVNIFFTHNLWYYYRQVGKQFSCLTQASNHIIGHDKMYRKDFVGQALVDYAKGYTSRPECFNFEKYFPKTWVLVDADQCRNFFAEFNSEHYQNLKKERKVVYFRKIGANVHEGKGVFPVTDEEELKIRKLYKNGTACGLVKDNNLIQYNVHNPLLLENRKFGFRSFLLVASTNPVIAYYHDGYLRLSLDEYDSGSKEAKTFVTNIGVNLKEATKDSIFKDMSELQINEYTTWFLEKLGGYLLYTGKVDDPNWINNYLRKEFKKVMIHLIRMSQDTYAKKSSLFELYGLDFVMDDDLNLWFIEANTMPLVNGTTAGSTKLMNRMLIDTFEIIHGLVKSRAKRIIDYINDLSSQVQKISLSGAQLPNLEQRKAEFAKLTQNRFEPEFEVSKENTFHKIIDENEQGTTRYADLLSSECL